MFKFSSLQKCLRHSRNWLRLALTGVNSDRDAGYKKINSLVTLHVMDEFGPRTPKYKHCARWIGCACGAHKDFPENDGRTKPQEVRQLPSESCVSQPLIYLSNICYDDKGTSPWMCWQCSRTKVISQGYSWRNDVILLQFSSLAIKRETLYSSLRFRVAVDVGIFAVMSAISGPSGFVWTDCLYLFLNKWKKVKSRSQKRPFKQDFGLWKVLIKANGPTP